MFLSEINIYPVKSLSGISLQESVIVSRGLENDRRYMLIDKDNDLITQREFPELATLRTVFVDSGLEISSIEGASVIISTKFRNSQMIKVRVWDSFCDAVVAEREVNDWFSDITGTSCRLVWMPETTHREINRIFNAGSEIVSFADGYPLLIICENSLNDLNSKLDHSIPMNRFRPNLVVADCDPFSEDGWKKIRIGDTVLRAAKPCARCVVTTINQQTGISDVKEPLRTLSDFRKSIDVFPSTFGELGLEKNDVLFGINFVPESFGHEIKIGDAVELE
jgi:uncharacterized protein YcbX